MQKHTLLLTSLIALASCSVAYEPVQESSVTEREESWTVVETTQSQTSNETNNSPDVQDEVRTNIGSIEKAGHYTAIGVVAGLNDKGFVLIDNTGAIYVDMNGAPKYELGDRLKVTGDIDNSNSCFRNGLHQFNASSIIEEVSTDETIKSPIATPLTFETLNGWKETPSRSFVTKYSWTAVAGSNGSTTTLNMVGSNLNIEPYCLDSSSRLIDGNTYQVEGFFLGFNGFGGFASVLVTSVKESKSAESEPVNNQDDPLVDVNEDEQSTSSIKIEGDNTIKVDSTITLKTVIKGNNRSVVWTTSNDNVSVVNGLVTGLSEGTCIVTASLLDDLSVSDSMVITVLEKDYTFNMIANSFSNTPTKITTDVLYTLDSVSLCFSSTLLIDEEEELAKYTYSKQKLNQIGVDADEAISTETGCIYIRGMQIGTYGENAIEWVAIDGDRPSFYQLNLDESLLQNVNIEGRYMSASVKPGMEFSFFSGDYQASDVDIEVSVSKDGNASSYKMNYTSSLGATVSSFTKYGYGVQKISL